MNNFFSEKLNTIKINHIDAVSAKISVSNLIADQIDKHAQIHVGTRGEPIAAQNYLYIQFNRLTHGNITERLVSFYTKDSSEQYKRFIYLLNAHMLSNESMLELLEPFGYTLASLANEEKAIALMTPQVIDHLSRILKIDPKWLKCETNLFRKQTPNNSISPIDIIKKYFSALIAGERGRLVIVTDERARNNHAQDAYFQVYLCHHVNLQGKVTHIEDFGQSKELHVYECLGKFEYINEHARRGFKYVMLMFNFMRQQLGHPIDEIFISSGTLRQLDDSLQIVNSHFIRNSMGLQINWKDIELKHANEFSESGLNSNEYEENKILKYRFENSGIKAVLNELIEIYSKKSSKEHNLDAIFKSIRLQ